MGKDIEAVISYWKDDGSGIPNPETDAELFFGHADEDNHSMLIRDIRGTESRLSLDTNGFEVHILPKKERDPTNEEVVKTEYFKEICDLIKNMLGISYLRLSM